MFLHILLLVLLSRCGLFHCSNCCGCSHSCPPNTSLCITAVLAITGVITGNVITRIFQIVHQAFFVKNKEICHQWTDEFRKIPNYWAQWVDQANVLEGWQNSKAFAMLLYIAKPWCIYCLGKLNSFKNFCQWTIECQTSVYSIIWYHWSIE